MSRNICYFVDEIASSFVINDIIKVAERFENVYLFSIEVLEGKDNLPANVLVFEKFMDWSRFSPIGTLLRNPVSILGIYIRERRAIKKPLPFRQAIAILASNIFKAKEIMRHLNRAENPGLDNMVFYSFWFYDCNYLAWMKRQGLIRKAVSRAHAGDLYEDGVSLKGNILFRNFQLKYLDAIFPISNTGRLYLEKTYKLSRAAYRTIYLGSNDQKALNPFDGSKFVMVSCASLRYHKRIHAIAEALLHIDFPLTWYHFGDENLHTSDPKIPEYIERKKQLQKRSNITYIPMGFVDNSEILEFYKSNSVNLFVSLSAAEGIPVSIMEAASFGIPTLSTDVGGCREIVNEQTGVLIPLETGASEVAMKITEFRSSEKNTPGFRSVVRQFWEREFDAEVNYRKFFEIVLN